MSDSAPRDPSHAADQIMAVAVFSQVLAATDASQLGEKLTEQLRELTGARTVMVVTHGDEPHTHELLHACPTRRKTLFSAADLELLCPQNSPPLLSGRVADFSPNHPLRALLLHSGIESLLRVPLSAGGHLIGMLLLLDLPALERIDEMDRIVTHLSPVLALALRNALAHRRIEQQARQLDAQTRELEQRVAERTAELKSANETLETSRLAALSLMEKAVEAREWADRSSAALQEEIAKRKRDEEALQRLNRELHAISDCNEAMMRAFNEQALLDDICRIVCEEAGYRMSWVGYPEYDAAKTIRPVAWAGFEDDYLEQAQITWADMASGRGPSGAAVRSGISVCIQDFTIDPSAAPWRDAALRRGYRSSIALPLKDEGANTFGILNIYSSVPNAFTPAEIRLLEELAGDLAFGIMILRARIERNRSEKIMQARLRLLEFAGSHSMDELLTATLDEIEVLTGSTIGFYHFVEADQQTLTLHSWSTNTINNMCTAEGSSSHYAVDQAGVWADCVHERRPLIHNDYASLPQRKGMPEGYASVIREVVVPIFRGEQIVAIVGVGNKPADYVESDIEIVAQLGDLSWDVAERMRVEGEIRQLNQKLEQRVAERTEQLEAANRELEAFAYSVSHDLRAPLRAIDGFSHILLEDYADKLDDEGKRLFSVVRDNTARMGQLIEDILAFSRAGRLEINFFEIDMQKMARAVFAELQPADAESKPQLEIEPMPPARGDSPMMRQVFANLLSNAIKFSRTRQTPLVKVGARVEGKETVYYVKDNGVGFDMQYADKLFGVFQRLHTDDEFEGTGIGLAIIKRIISRHGGRVWAESKVDEGATFYFALPTGGT